MPCCTPLPAALHLIDLRLKLQALRQLRLLQSGRAFPRTGLLRRVANHPPGRRVAGPLELVPMGPFSGRRSMHDQRPASC